AGPAPTIVILIFRVEDYPHVDALSNRGLCSQYRSKRWRKGEINIEGFASPESVGERPLRNLGVLCASAVISSLIRKTHRGGAENAEVAQRRSLPRDSLRLWDFCGYLLTV